MNDEISVKCMTDTLISAHSLQQYFAGYLPQSLSWLQTILFPSGCEP